MGNGKDGIECGGLTGEYERRDTFYMMKISESSENGKKREDWKRNPIRSRVYRV
jgi:hypothetical protein